MFKIPKPFVVIMGCTGTGKSDMAIEIARKFDGEVISADSQQIYKGLDIVTNKVTTEETKGVKHHLMSYVDPANEKYNVHDFKSKCIEIMEDLWKQNKLPIICGGTSYYIESIIFDRNLIATDERDVTLLRKDLKRKSNDELYDILVEIDKDSANLVHRNNRARVQRAIEIAKVTGTSKSEHLREQNDSEVKLRWENVLFINMDAEEKVLDERLDKRIDKMVNRGLKEELKLFYQLHSHVLKDHGVMQCIGIKEFIPWLKDETEDNFRDGVNKLQIHTKQYARKQRKWLKQRLMNKYIENIFLMDTSDVLKFYQSNVPIGLDITHHFLEGSPLSDLEVDEKYCNHWKRCNVIEQSNKKDLNTVYKCTDCSIEIHGGNNWEAHLNGKKHKMLIRRMKKLKE
uniref:Zf-C2H2_jaz domain-containing protein n=1 Tax=Rhabditophanes sp. KR3021 TaxID=114890 RepID=A0AC35TLG8_9BILA